LAPNFYAKLYAQFSAQKESRIKYFRGL
jgi:hypothetical protein